MIWGGGRQWGQERKPKPAEGRIHYSPSQIKTFRDCQRKWAFKYILKAPDRPYYLAQLGTYIHKQLERYLKSGWLQRGPGIALSIETPRGKRTWTHDQIVAIMLPGVVHLPPPGVAETERKFVLPLGELGDMTGIQDFSYDGEDGVRVVGDHKTTSDLRYALTPHELEQDPQGVIYSKAEMVRHCVKHVRGRWIYYRTSKPRSLLVEADFFLDRIEPLLQSVLCDVRTMYEHRRHGTHPNDIEPNTSACGKFGGCPYSEICGLTAGDRIRSLSQMATIKERMAAAQSAQQAPAQAPAPAQSPAPAQAPAPAQSPAPVQAPAPAQAAGFNPPEGLTPLQRLQAAKTAAAGAATGTDPAPVAQAPATPAPAPVATNTIQDATPAGVIQAQAPAGEAEKYLDLYIDCAPNVTYIEFADLAQPVIDGIKTEYGHHYRLIPDLYGGGPALFAEAMAVHLDATGGPMEPVVVTMASPMVRDVIEVLQARARRIVRGF